MINQDQFAKGFYAMLSKKATQVPGTQPAPVKADNMASTASGTPPAAVPGPAPTPAPAGSIKAPQHMVQKPIPARTIPPSNSPPDNPNLTHPTGAQNSSMIPDSFRAPAPQHYWSIDPRHWVYEKPQENARQYINGYQNQLANAPAADKEQMARSLMSPEQQTMYDQGKQISQAAKGFTDDKGQFSFDKSLGTVGNYLSKNVSDPLWNEGKELLGGNFGSLGGFAQQHPWLTGAAGLLGGAGLYGGYKLLSGLGGDGEEAPQAQHGNYYPNNNAYGVPQPQALMKASKVKEAISGMPFPMSVPTLAAGFLTGSGNKPHDPNQDFAIPTQEFNVHADPRAKILLQNPQMRAYVQRLITGT